MSDETKHTTKIVSVNWEGLKRFLGWQGSIAELKRLELDRSDSTLAAAAGSKRR